MELLDLGAIRRSLAAQLFEVRFEVREELRLEALRFLDATRRISADGRLGRLGFRDRPGVGRRGIGRRDGLGVRGGLRRRVLLLLHASTDLLAQHQK